MPRNNGLEGKAVLLLMKMVLRFDGGHLASVASIELDDRMEHPWEE